MSRQIVPPKIIFKSFRLHGPPTFFCTFSCAEYDWIEVKMVYQLLYPNLAATDVMQQLTKVCFTISISNRTLKDPVPFCRLFEHRFNALLHIVLGKGGPLGDIIHRWVNFSRSFLVNFVTESVRVSSTWSNPLSLLLLGKERALACY